MEQIRAKVRLIEGGNTANLLDTFFRFFNPKNSIKISGGEAEIKAWFEETPPTELIKVISECEVVEFEYEPAAEGEIVHLIDETNPYEQELPEIEIAESNKLKVADEEPEKDEPWIPATITAIKFAKPNESKTSKFKISNINKIEAFLNESTDPNELEIRDTLGNLAQNANSLEHFAELIGELFDLKEKQKEMLVNLIVASTEVEVVAWDKLEVNFKIHEKKWPNTYDKQQINKNISEKMSVTLLKFLKIMKKYEEYFLAKMAEAQKGVQESSASRAEYWRIFSMVDKNQPIEERVENVLAIMENKDNTLEIEVKEQFSKILATAVKMREMDVEEILTKSGIAAENQKETQVKLSTFVNDFIKRNGGNGIVRVSKFFYDVQKCIIKDEEISD